MVRTSARLHPREPARALCRSDLSDTFVVGKYSFSPYMACEHGCAYCDGRAERYWVEGDFERDVVVRRNLPGLLAHELPRLREPGFVTVGSGISDAYQPVEAQERLMRACLEVLAEHGFPVTVMTKSALALRDLDLLAAINARSRFVFVVSLVHAGDATRQAFEPLAATVEERLDSLRAFKEAGCVTGVLAMPLLPGITDDDQTLARLYDQLARCGVDFVQPAGLTLRPGRQKAFFLERLRRARPDLGPLYTRLYAAERASGAPLRTYTNELSARCHAQTRRTGIPPLVPHAVYRGHLRAYDELAVLMRHMSELYAVQGRDTTRLGEATRRYLDWLTPRKREYNRHRSWDYRSLDAELAAPGALERILGNPRLAGFLRQVLSGDGVFNYATLRLEAKSPAARARVAQSA